MHLKTARSEQIMDNNLITTTIISNVGKTAMNNLTNNNLNIINSYKIWHYLFIFKQMQVKSELCHTGQRFLKIREVTKNIVGDTQKNLG